MPMESEHRYDIYEKPADDLLKKQEKGGETQEAGLKILEDNERRISVAVFAGKEYSRGNEAARVDVELYWQGGAQHARVSSWSQAEFADDSGALRHALNAAEARAAQRGVHFFSFDLPEDQSRQLSASDRKALTAGLRQDGYWVYAGDEAPRGFELVARKSIKPQEVRIHEAQLPKPEAPGDRKAAIAPDELELEIEDHPLEHEINIMVPRFENEQQVNEYVERALYEINNSRSGRRFVNHLPEGMTLRELVQKTSEHDVLTKTAALAQDARLGSTAIGSLVHRISELRQLHHHPKDVIAGIRDTEQTIEFIDGHGDKHRVELDTVIVRGENHYIRDNKPINLAEFEATPEGQDWAAWMQRNFGDDYRQQIRRGELTPFAQGQTVEEPLDKQTRSALREYLAGEAARHKKQLENYRQHYARATNAPLERVSATVRPYFVYR